MERIFAAKESLVDRRLPPLSPRAVSSDHERREIRFVIGPDTPSRRRELAACVNHLAGPRGQKLVVPRKHGGLDEQLGDIRAWVTDRCAQYAARRVVVGIDGMDQWLTSASAAASQLRAILNVGASVACAVDSRYGDFRLLMLHLRILGIEVICEPYFPKRLTGVSTGPEMQRLSSEAKCGVPVRQFPCVQTPALAAYAFDLQHVKMRPTWNNRAGQQRELTHRWSSEGGTHSAFSQYKQNEYARLYRNDFAINRLLRELFDV
ncbi:hypothetical protein ACFQ3P_06860 [Paraburkholderia sabiae]|uniref:Uncharacterized protein n=1 Tax=Paraburkholderia sabiae TaxID=273251 RepID=A0ABU9QKG5_9BURK|nr:hypothetical protein [Paraburkholderia sabiae]WJZ76465.1 hypothetical protein QEN71_11910 [Paraburkholderia sabiae]